MSIPSKSTTWSEEREFRLWQKSKKLTTQELLDRLYHKKEDIRYAAAKELQIRGENITFLKATELCEHPQAHFREVGAFLLGQLGTPTFPFAKDSIPLLIKLFQFDESGEVRATAAASMGHLRDEEVIPTLVQGIYDSSCEVRQNVAFALGAFHGNAKIVAPLLLLLKDTAPDVRNWAACGLRYCLCEEPSIADGLVEVLNDRCEEVRREAICALAQLHDQRVFHALKKELNSEPVFDEIIEAAGNLQDVRLLGRLQQLREAWKDDIPQELTIAITKLEGS